MTGGEAERTESLGGGGKMRSRQGQTQGLSESEEKDHRKGSAPYKGSTHGVAVGQGDITRVATEGERQLDTLWKSEQIGSRPTCAASPRRPRFQLWTMGG